MYDLYRLMELSPSASDREIKLAWRRLAVTFHPDLNPGAEHSAAVRFKELLLAYEILSDPLKRRDYDATYAATNRSQGTIPDENVVRPFERWERTCFHFDPPQDQIDLMNEIAGAELVRNGINPNWYVMEFIAGRWGLIFNHWAQVKLKSTNKNKWLFDKGVSSRTCEVDWSTEKMPKKEILEQFNAHFPSMAIPGWQHGGGTAVVVRGIIGAIRSMNEMKLRPDDYQRRFDAIERGEEEESWL